MPEKSSWYRGGVICTVPGAVQSCLPTLRYHQHCYDLGRRQDGKTETAQVSWKFLGGVCVCCLPGAHHNGQPQLHNHPCPRATPECKNTPAEREPTPTETPWDGESRGGEQIPASELEMAGSPSAEMTARGVVGLPKRQMQARSFASLLLTLVA